MPTNSPRKDTRRRIPCQPADWALNVTGQSSPEINQAVEIFSRFILEAQFENAARFEPGEWMAIADASMGYVTTTEARHPGEQLSGMLLSKCNDFSYDIRYKIKVARTAQKLALLKPNRAWAVVYTLKFFWRNVEALKLADPPVPWWHPRFQNQWRDAVAKGLDPMEEWRRGN